MPTWHAVIGIGASVDGAVVGDTLNPYASTTLSAGDYLLTENIGVGDAGDFSGLSEMAVEFWFKPNSVTVAGLPDTLFYGATCTSTNRQFTFVLNSGGAVVFNLRNPGDTAFVSVTSSVTLRVNEWAHIVGTYDGANIRVYINGADAGSTAYTGAIPTTTGASGLQLLDNTGVLAPFFDEIAIYRHKLTASRVAAHFTAGTLRGRPFETAGPRISALLDSISSSAPRSLQTGSRNVVETYFNGDSALSKIEQAEAAENVDALFFCARDGTLTFLAADHRSAAPYNTDQAIFGDAGGAELPYQDLNLDYADAFIVNEWTVMRSVGRKVTGSNEGLGQVASDATSISRYFKRPRAVSDVPVTTDTNALAIANALLPKYKDPMLKITSITVRTFDAGLTEAIFRRDLGDKIRILYTPLGGGARIDQSSWIQKIEVDGTPSEPWTIRLGVSPL